jgi:DNA-binding SARP family transcriptional activator
VRVRVMAPTVTVEVNGQRCQLRAPAARLLLALVLAHPAPLAAEAAAGALWPEGFWGTDRRRRLNTVVHRLRQSLGDVGAAVGRVGDVLSLDPAGWDVDLFRLRQALDAAPAADDAGSALADALAGVRGNLGHVQFPYDEQLVDERRALVGAVVRRLDADGTLLEGQHACIEALRALGART